MKLDWNYASEEKAMNNLNELALESISEIMWAWEAEAVQKVAAIEGILWLIKNAKERKEDERAAGCSVDS